MTTNAAAGLTIKGTDTLIHNLEVIEKKMNDAVADALRESGGEVIRVTTPKVPLDTGELRSRSFNEGPLKISGKYVQVVGYEKNGEQYGKENPKAAGVFYAVPLHEDLEAHHDVGEAKFLEKGAAEAAPVIGRVLRDTIRGQVRL